MKRFFSKLGIIVNICVHAGLSSIVRRPIGPIILTENHSNTYKYTIDRFWFTAIVTTITTSVGKLVYTIRLYFLKYTISFFNNNNLYKIVAKFHSLGSYNYCLVVSVKKYTADYLLDLPKSLFYLAPVLH